MSALCWRVSGKDKRTAEGHYGRVGDGRSWYELEREHYMATTGTYWTTWFYDGSELGPVCLATKCTFHEARRAAMVHHNDPATESDR